MSLDTANDESYNNSKAPWMQNLSSLGLTNTTGEGHNAHSTLTGPCRFWQGTQGWLRPHSHFKAACIQNLGQDFSCGS